ncbi:L-alanine-DL-glutamate epimerase-like enolase superfamily enzyme [Hasllibacter halocynthiae]|uniref:Dipeptide epimerase n=1 Tax=Hasllibacter halocynthiae TaxID=595589 RepID=A0A2T0X3Y0_9RHOB|nr:N-acetyl-D-Glu racemase DgcA [Hasllibacter halocynthiae]PRY93649.1 L-alanine-DL-glutamate epimerase-like enolase superfamily enzyme [Hasllibacter halocynthiae]
MEIDVRRERFRLQRPFTISRGTRTHAEVLTVTLREGGHSGRGECVPYARYGETPDSVDAQIRDWSGGPLEGMPAGAARNALDCALWDLRAKREGRPVWALAGLPRPGPEVTAYTLSLGSPEEMRRQASENAWRPLLKVKLGTEDDVPRIEAVRAGAPDARLVADANEGWTADLYAEIAPVLVRLGLEMVEQPLPVGEDDALGGMARPLPVCADESCHVTADLARLAGLYDVVNVKLDKTGGFSEALRLREAARARGFEVMVGCMVGTSLAMAPAVLAAQGAAVTDLDGPLLLAEDRETPLRFDREGVHPPDPALWG